MCRASEAHRVEATGESLDLGLERQEPARGALPQHLLEVHELGATLSLDLGGDIDSLADKLAHLHKVSLDEAPRSHRRGANAKAIRVHGALIARNGVLVEHDGSLFANGLSFRAVHLLGAEVDEEEMVVRATGDEIEAAPLQGLPEGLGVLHHLLLVQAELRRHGLLQRHSQGGDGLVVRAALEAREHSCVDPLLQVVHDRVALLVHTLLTLAEEDHRTTRAPQRLVRGGRDDIRKLEG
mmetsp:Transcript_98064/g.219445  ORF Transcript_98064/g.219445 Transcript_98064/m.219445 type:complete len:239 (-) Transcript_98064:866-1582(-)